MFHPILIAGVALVGLPIVLHLIMRQKPKRVPFPAFRFLKMKSRINQRKIRLRHLLLLLMRMLLIALMAWALFQPRLDLSGRSQSIGALAGDQPLGVVLVMDTSPSMGYEIGDTSRLAEARRRALEFLDAIPSESSVIVLDTGEPLTQPDWSQGSTVTEARNHVERLSVPKAGSRPVTAMLDQAYRLFRKLNQDRGGPDDPPLPCLLAIISDRAAHAWQVDRLDELKSQRDSVGTEVASVFVDVGTDEPINLSLGETDHRIAYGSTARDRGEAVVDLTVNVRAEGKDFDDVVICRVDGGGTERLPVSLKAGQGGSVTFRLTGLTPGLHRAEISLIGTDALSFDNLRFVTFLVPEPTPILVLADRPEEAWRWELALESSNRYQCDVRKSADVRDWESEDWNRYEAVCLHALASPSGALWEQLTAYVGRGGHLVVIPGGEEMEPRSYTSEPAKALLPGNYQGLIDAEDPAEGTTWLWNSLNYRHELLAPFRTWEQEGDIDFIRIRPRAFRYWRVEPFDKNNSIVSYDDTDTNPAMLERAWRRGRVVMLTTTMDGRRFANDRPWNDYFETSFFLVPSEMTIRYLVGDKADVATNFITGQRIRIPLPLEQATREQQYTLDGPGISGADAIIRPPSVPEGSDQEGIAVGPRDFLEISPRLTSTAGNFTIRSADRSWETGFGLNPPPSESVLAKVDVEQVEELFGEDSILAPDKEIDLGDALQTKFNRWLDLFPWLMVLLLMFFALEGLLANLFYRQETPAKS